MKNAKFSFELDIVKAKRQDEEQGDWTIVGYASTYDVDSDGMQITRQALEGAKDDLIKYNTVLFNHNYDRPVGKVVSTETDDKGLLVKIVVSKTEKDLWAKIEDGTISKFSISGTIGEYVETSPDKEGRSIVQITVIRLYEVSIVSVPANVEAATISSYIAKSIQKNDDIEKKGKNNCKCEDCGYEMSSDEKCSVLECSKCGKPMKSTSKSIESIDDIKKGLIQTLEILAGKLDGESKQLLDDIISVLKGRKKTDNTTKSMKIKEFQLNDTSAIRPVFQLNTNGAIDLDDENTFRKQILKHGKWFHWNADGGYLNITKELISNIVKNFNSRLVENVSVPLTHTNDPAKNTGEVVELQQTDKGLDAIIKIKDNTVAEKIRNGLIKSISASIDPNYLRKDKKEFSGPVLLHAALVQEPYIKGMGGFIELGDDFENRPIVDLEDAEQNPAEIIKSAAIALTRAAEMLEQQSKTDTDTETTDTTDTKETDAKIDKETEPSGDEPAGDEPKGDEPDDNGEGKKEGDDPVNLSDAEGTYTKYLNEGKIVPAQKDAFMDLMRLSKKAVELGDNEVDVKKLVLNFLDKTPKVLNFDEDGVTPDPVNPAPTPVEKPDDMPEEAKKFFTDQMELSEDDARKAWETARDIHNAENADTGKSIF